MFRPRSIAAIFTIVILAYCAFRGWGSSFLLRQPLSPVDLGPIPDVSSPHRVRFIALGDSGKGNRTQAEIAASVSQICTERGCDFALLLGDNVYPAGMRSPEDPEIDRVFTTVYRDLPLRFFAVLGNHDYGDSTEESRAENQVEWARRQSRLVLPERAYGFTGGPSQFLALDTTEIFWHGGGRQSGWVRETLSTSKGPRWRVAFGHHPYRSNGPHGNAGAYDGVSWAPFASGRRFERFFEQDLCGRVHLYLSGHDHNQQWLEACGVSLVVSGAAASSRPFTSPANASFFQADTPGFAWVELAKDMRVAFYDAAGRLEFEGTRPWRSLSP